MTSILDNENSSLELADNVSTDFNEDDKFFYEFFEYEDYKEEETDYKHDKQHEYETGELSRYSKELILEYSSFLKEEEEYQDYADFSPNKYDLPQFDFEPLKPEERQEIIEKLKELHIESKVLIILNKFLHKNYINAMRNSTSLANALEKFDEALVFEDNRYQTALENYALTRDDVSRRRASLAMELRNLEECYASSKSSFEEVFEDLLSRELAVIKKFDPLKQDEIRRMLDSQRNRASEVAKIRLRYVRLRHRLEKLLVQLREFDFLGPGFSMMDYELLLRRRKVHVDKREELREGSRKLADKNLSCAAVIKHIDEEAELFNEKVNNETDNLNAIVEKNRKEHSKAVELVKTRAATFKTIMKLREEIGLLDNLYLVHKMEMDMRELAKLKKQSRNMKFKIRLDKRRISQVTD